MSKLRREVGFWPLLARAPVGQLLFSPEAIGAFLLTLGGYFAYRVTTVGDRVDAVGDFLVISGALLGIVFAALALVVSFFSDEYLRLLDEAPNGGVKVFLSPFMVAVGLQVGALFAAISYRIVATNLPGAWEQWTFLATCFLFAYATLDVVALGRSVLLHALNRARTTSIQTRDRNGVHDLRNRRDTEDG